MEETTLNIMVKDHTHIYSGDEANYLQIKNTAEDMVELGPADIEYITYDNSTVVDVGDGIKTVRGRQNFLHR